MSAVYGVVDCRRWGELVSDGLTPLELVVLTDLMCGELRLRSISGFCWVPFADRHMVKRFAHVATEEAVLAAFHGLIDRELVSWDSANDELFVAERWRHGRVNQKWAVGIASDIEQQPDNALWAVAYEAFFRAKERQDLAAYEPILTALKRRYRESNIAQQKVDTLSDRVLDSLSDRVCDIQETRNKKQETLDMKQDQIHSVHSPQKTASERLSLSCVPEGPSVDDFNPAVSCFMQAYEATMGRRHPTVLGNGLKRCLDRITDLDGLFSPTDDDWQGAIARFFDQWQQSAYDSIDDPLIWSFLSVAEGALLSVGCVADHRAWGRVNESREPIQQGRSLDELMVMNED